MSWWSSLGKEIYKATPLDNIVNSYDAIRAGDLGRLGKEIAGGAIDIGLMAIPGGAAIKGARAAGAGLGRAALAGVGSSLGVPGAARTFGRAGASSLLGRAAAFGAGLVGTPVGRGALNAAFSSLPAGGASTPQLLRPPFMTADMAERRAQAAGNRMGVEERRMITADQAERAAGVTPFVDTSAVTGVGGPTGDMMAKYEELLRVAQEDYERQMANLAEARATAEEDYRLGTRRSRRGTAGRSANLAALLAATGMDLSPAAAEGGLSYEAQRGARELAAQERARMQARTGATRGEAEADAERKRTIATLNRWLMTAPAAAAGNAGIPGF